MVEAIQRPRLAAFGAFELFRGDLRERPPPPQPTRSAELRGEGVDIGIISKQLGHSSIATTARYLDHIAPLAVVEVVAARAWHCRGARAARH